MTVCLGPIPGLPGPLWKEVLFFVAILSLVFLAHAGASKSPGTIHEAVTFAIVAVLIMWVVAAMR
jgi:hypothetical protein